MIRYCIIKTNNLHNLRGGNVRLLDGAVENPGGDDSQGGSIDQDGTGNGTGNGDGNP